VLPFRFEVLADIDSEQLAEALELPEDEE